MGISRISRYSWKAASNRALSARRDKENQSAASMLLLAGGRRDTGQRTVERGQEAEQRAEAAPWFGRIGTVSGARVGMGNL